MTSCESIMSKYFFKCTLNFKENNADEETQLFKKELLLRGEHSSEVFVRRDGLGQDETLCISLTEGDSERKKTRGERAQAMKAYFSLLHDELE